MSNTKKEIYAVFGESSVGSGEVDRFANLDSAVIHAKKISGEINEDEPDECIEEVYVCKIVKIIRIKRTPEFLIEDIK